MNSSHRSLRNTLLLLLVAAALSVRAFLPGGTMLASDNRGEVVITLCNSDALLVLPLKGKTPSPAEGEAGKPCLYAHLADNSVPPDPLARPALPLAAQPVWNATREKARSPASKADLPPATGPPAFV